MICSSCGILSSFVGKPRSIWEDGFLSALLFSSVIGYLSLRGWTNITLFLALILVAFRWQSVWPEARAYVPELRGVMLVLFLPIAVLLISQAARQDWIVKAYDGPARMLICIPLMLYLCTKRMDFARLLGVAAPLALFVLVAEVKLNPSASAFWGGRFATYFVDTDTFGVYALIFATFCLFSIDRATAACGKWLLALQLAGVVAGGYLLIGSQTRGAWVALPIVFALWFILRGRTMDRRYLLTLSGGLLLGLMLALVLFPGAAARLSSVFNEVSMWRSGAHRDSSAGLRLTMWHMSWELFKHSPLFGYGDTGFRVYLNEPWITSFASLDARSTILNGPHNEFLANILRSGVLGGVAVIGLFLAPFRVFWRQRSCQDAQVAKASHIGMAYLVCLMVSSISFEVFNLKYTSTFYGIVISCLVAQVVSGQRLAGRSQDSI